MLLKNAKVTKIEINTNYIYIINSSVNLFEYEKIGLEILQSCEIERKMTSLLMQKFEKQRM